MCSMIRLVALATLVFGPLAVQAMPEIPKEAVKQLGYTRGKSIKTGLVFIDGKYIAEPYVVERWGNCIRINGIQATGQIIDWVAFLKTQEGFKPVQTAPVQPPAADQAGQEAEASSIDSLFEDDDDAESSLDDLFDDDPQPKKKKPAKKPAARARAPKAPAAPAYEFNGEFVANDSSKALVAKINSLRTDIDKHLRSGGFICFGKSYSRVLGDSGAALRLLECLPDIMRSCDDQKLFISRVRAAGLIYFPDELYRDLFANKMDYRNLDRRGKKWKKDIEWKKVLNESATPLF